MIDKNLKINGLFIAGIIIIISFVYTINIQPVVFGSDITFFPTIDKNYSNGNKLWDRTFGGIKDDTGSSVQQTSDRGYIITGETSSFGTGNNDIWLIKADSQGKSKPRLFGNLWFERFLQRFPFFEKILNQIL